MKLSRSTLAALALTTTLAQAEAPQADRVPLPLNFAAMLDLDTARAQVVEAILENAHRRILVAREQIGRPSDATTRVVMQVAMRAICDDADKQLASVLTAPELARLKELVPLPESPGAHAQWTPM
jgi:hypothetical protein